MSRDAGQGHPLPLPNRPGGEHQIQLPGDDLRIRIEGLVEIAEPEKQDGVRMLAFQIQILTPDGGEILHRTASPFRYARWMFSIPLISP
jgi:hypothetical protein